MFSHYTMLLDTKSFIIHGIGQDDGNLGPPALQVVSVDPSPCKMSESVSSRLPMVAIVARVVSLQQLQQLQHHRSRLQTWESF